MTATPVVPDVDPSANGSEPPDWVREPDGGSSTRPPSTGGLLEFRWIADVLRDLASRPPPQFLARPVWPADAYGIIGAGWKVGKTWLVEDLAVAVAGGGAWLGHFPIERSGPVLIFLGEGGDRKMARRLRAIAAEHDLELDQLPIRLCFRAPHLLNSSHLEQMEEEIKATRPVLVIVDPLYLAARGAQGSQLYEMGAHLEAIQNLCQRYCAALAVVHHHNRQEGRGSARLSGAGPAEWGRVIVTADVVSKHNDLTTGESNVVLDLDFIGDEIADTSLRVRRKVVALDQDDLSSPLLYSVEILDRVAGDDEGGLRPSHRRVLDVICAATDEWLDKREIGDRLAVDSSGLGGMKARTIQDAAHALLEKGLIESRGGVGFAFQWRGVRTPPSEEVENAF